MRTMFSTIALLVACASAVATASRYETAASAAHPRLILTADRLAAISAWVSNNTDAAYFWEQTQAQAAYLLTRNPDGPGNGGDCRQVLQQTYTLSLTAGLTGNETYAQRAIAELMNAAAASEWDPNGTATLNTGEMIHALGVGLDWNYGVLTPAQRATIVSAIVNTGLIRIWNAFAQPHPTYAVAFINTTSNWNAVVLGGTIIGCLAVAGEPGVPSWVPQLLEAALANVLAWSDRGFGFVGDGLGGWPESINYQGYAMRYMMPTAYSLLTATGNDGGLRTPGVLYSPRFMVSSMAPMTQYFYWADSHADPETLSQYLAAAAAANDLGAMYAVRALTRAMAPLAAPNTTATQAMDWPVALVYFDGRGAAADLASWPRLNSFSWQHVTYVRSSWADEDTATYFGWKGSNVSWAWAHNHLDATAFVYATQRQWFAQELGNDNYAAPSYFGPDRYALYRTSMRGHNTLSLDLKNTFCIPAIATYESNCTINPQELLVDNTNASSPSTAADSVSATLLAADAYAIVNISSGYAYLNASRAARGFIVTGGIQQLITVDEVELLPTASIEQVWWTMHTVANITISSDGATATLTMWNVSTPVTVAVITDNGNTQCPGFAFRQDLPDLCANCYPAPGVTRLGITAPAATCKRLTVTVGMNPVTAGFTVNPLQQWAASGPLAA